MRRAQITLADGTMLVIRDMLPEDVAEVARLEAETFSMPWSAQAFLEEIGRADRLYVVVVADEHLAGYCGMLCMWGEGDITNVAVAPVMRRKGIADRMLRTAFEWAGQMDVREFTLEVRKGNEAAIRLYENLGFVTEGIRRDFYEKPREDGLIMWKRQAEDGTITTEN